MSKQQGLIYRPNFISPKERAEILRYLTSLHPIWEWRYSRVRPLAADKNQRLLLRPVYWLGNWQFACLDYYHPPKGVDNRCVEAESFPPSLQNLVDRMESIIRAEFDERDIPREWHLNTCLINYYGDNLQSGEKALDCARVGEHKDFEPGPVASISFGEKALFQFVESHGKDKSSQVKLQMWLEDSAFQAFGGDRLKKKWFHRVQRVERKQKVDFSVEIPGYDTRRINLTFRYVPTMHVIPYAKLPHTEKLDIQDYMRQLAEHSDFFKEALGSAEK